MEELERELRSLREHLDEVMGKVRAAMGEFKALRGALGGAPGTEEGVFARAEHEEIQRLRVELEEALLGEVGRVVREHEVDFSRFSREAYWLPEDRELFRSKIVVFLDTSGSIPLPAVNLFMNWVNRAAKKYGVEVDVAVFAVGVLEKHRGVSSSRGLKAVALGGGTVWDESVAREILAAAREEVPLIVVLSDMMISVSREAMEALRLYKRRGGRVSCWTLGDTREFCDRTHRLPSLFRILRW